MIRSYTFIFVTSRALNFTQAFQRMTDLYFS